MEKLVIWGASGHAKVITDIVNLQRKYQIVGYIDNINLSRKGQIFGGQPILGGEEQLELLKREGVNYLIFGFGDCQAKLELSKKVKLLGYKLAKVIHPSAVIAQDTEIGFGTVIAAGTVLNPAVRIEENVIINTATSVDHDCIIENAAHLSPGVRLGGGVKIGEATWIGIGAVVIDKVMIGKNCVVGAGTVVVQDIPDHVLAYGVPARVIREINKFDE